MTSTKRYHFWRVFWVVAAVYIFFGLIGFIAVYLAPVTEQTFDSKHFLKWSTLISQGAGIIFSAFFFYFTLNVFYRLISERKKAVDFVKYVVFAILSLAVYYTTTFFLLKDDEEMNKHMTVNIMLFSYSLASLFCTGFSLLIAYLTYLRDEKKKQKGLEAQKMQLEVEKSQANFNFLKAQINPHFLHNTLNFLYAKSLPYSPELSEGILTLSDIMRYALSEGNAKDGKAPLKDEIEHVRNVIKINQLRFSNNLNVQFDVEGVLNGKTIIPFVLITLVENAFKHGDLKSNETPIDIKAKVENNSLYFFCRNKKKLGPKELGTGIGLDNIKKRLDLAYGTNYAFHVKDEAGFYTTELTIKQL